MAGKPILAVINKGSVSAKLIQNEDLEWVCDFRDEDAIKSALTEILERYKENGSSPKSVVIHRNSSLKI